MTAKIVRALVAAAAHSLPAERTTASVSYIIMALDYYAADCAAVVPFDHDPLLLDSYNSLQDLEPFVPTLLPPPPGSLRKTGAFQHHIHAHAAVPVKPEPSAFDLSYDPRRAYWPPAHHHRHTGMMEMSQYPNTAPPAGGQPPLPLALSQPPTPGAECLVSSTMSPPLASPFSPRSDTDSLDGLTPTFDVDGQLPLDLGEINVKGLTEEQLVSLTARDLNRLCRDLPDDVIKQLKKRRRTLKNRGYAYNSRVRRVSQKNTLEKERDELKHQLAQLTDRCKALAEERNQWKLRAQALERGDESWTQNTK